MKPTQGQACGGRSRGGPSFFLVGGTLFLVTWSCDTQGRGPTPCASPDLGAAGRLARFWPPHGFSPWGFPSGKLRPASKGVCFVCTSGSSEQEVVQNF